MGKTHSLLTAMILVSLMVLLGCSVSPEEVFKKYTNKESKFIDINGTKVHYRDEGSGPVLLCMHGIFSSLHTWDGWVARLKKKYRIIRLDLPGWALTGHSTFGYTTEGYIDFLIQFLDKLKLKKINIAGNSFGGYLTWNFAIAHPERVSKMILIDAGGYPFSPPLPVMLMTMPVIDFFSTIITPKWIVAAFLYDIYGNTEKVTDKTIDRYYDLLLYNDNRKVAVTVLKKIEENIHDEPIGIDTIEKPTLIMWGGADDWIPLEVMERFRKDIPHAETIIYDGAGHIPMEEVPVQTATDADKFLRSR